MSMALPSSTASPLQSLSDKIGGFIGYESSATREPSDINLRSFLIAGIDASLKGLEAIPSATIEEDQRVLIEVVRSTRRKLATISESLSDPTYAGQDFFTRDHLAEKRLASIYSLEKSMLDELADIQLELAAFQTGPIEKSTIEDHFLHISDSIDNLNQALFERECLILGDQ